MQVPQVSQMTPELHISMLNYAAKIRNKYKHLSVERQMRLVANGVKKKFNITILK